MDETTKTIGGNYYAAKDYLDWDIKRGVLTARDGARVVAFPQCLVGGLFEGLEEECGQAWPVVLYRCGEWWGKRYMQRIDKNLSQHFGSSLRELPTGQVHASIIEALATEGWGRFKFNLDYLANGFIHAGVSSSPISEAFVAAGRDSQNRPVDSLTGGALAGMFSHAAEADFVGHQIACTVNGAASNEYLIGLRENLADVPNMVRQGMTAAEIISKLVENNTRLSQN